MQIAAEISGWVGMALIVAAYFLISFKRIEAANRGYQLMNLFGAIGLGVNVFYQQSWPALALEIIWGAIALFALFKK